MKSQKLACVSDKPKVTQYLIPNPGKTMSVNGRNSEQGVKTKINEVSANLSCVHDSTNLDASILLIAEIIDIFENVKKTSQEKIKEAVQQGWIINHHDQKQTDT